MDIFYVEIAKWVCLPYFGLRTLSVCHTTPDAIRRRECFIPDTISHILLTSAGEPSTEASLFSLCCLIEPLLIIILCKP